MNEKSRLQIITDKANNKWSDVGPDAEGVDVPVEIQETVPNDGKKNNPSYVLTRNGDDYVITIVQTVGLVEFTKTITRDVDNYITEISVWS